jgi:hypothetical protein
MEKDKVIDIEEYKLRELENDYREAMRGGKLKKMSTNTSGKIDDLVREIEGDEFTIFRETKRLGEFLVRGEYYF